jgi:hypothetical protein
MYFIQHCFICRPSDSTVSVEAGSNPGQSQLRHWLSDALATRLHLIHTRLHIVHNIFWCKKALFRLHWESSHNLQQYNKSQSRNSFYFLNTYEKRRCMMSSVFSIVRIKLKEIVSPDESIFYQKLLHASHAFKNVCILGAANPSISISLF